jgi:EAL domain-containing protein (putative c-di-GMP-specific phosphodiesterase class I)
VPAFASAGTNSTKLQLPANSFAAGTYTVSVSVTIPLDPFNRVAVATQVLVVSAALVPTLNVGLGGGIALLPGDLLPMLERRGLVRLFDHRVLEIAVSGLARDAEAVLSINVSPISLTDPVWLDAFRMLMRTHAGLSERLVIEVTETATISHAEESRRILGIIKDFGCRIAIDDFGAGHTSLRHLRDFPIDILKLDGAFTQNLSRSTDDRFFVRTLLDLAQHLGVETVAEWVDNEPAARMLAEWGVTYLQRHLTGAAELWDDHAPPGAATRAA